MPDFEIEFYQIYRKLFCHFIITLLFFKKPIVPTEIDFKPNDMKWDKITFQT